MKRTLTTLDEIQSALTHTIVFCKVSSDVNAQPVRAVRRKNGSLEVRVLEGWRTPIEVWVVA